MLLPVFIVFFLVEVGCLPEKRFSAVRRLSAQKYQDDYHLPALEQGLSLAAAWHRTVRPPFSWEFSPEGTRNPEEITVSGIPVREASYFDHRHGPGKPDSLVSFSHEDIKIDSPRPRKHKSKPSEAQSSGIITRKRKKKKDRKHRIKNSPNEDKLSANCTQVAGTQSRDKLCEAQRRLTKKQRAQRRKKKMRMKELRKERQRRKKEKRKLYRLADKKFPKGNISETIFSFEHLKNSSHHSLLLTTKSNSSVGTPEKASERKSESNSSTTRPNVAGNATMTNEVIDVAINGDSERHPETTHIEKNVMSARPEIGPGGGTTLRPHSNTASATENPMGRSSSEAEVTTIVYARANELTTSGMMATLGDPTTVSPGVSRLDGHNDVSRSDESRISTHLGEHDSLTLPDNHNNFPLSDKYNSSRFSDSLDSSRSNNRDNSSISDASIDFSWSDKLDNSSSSDDTHDNSSKIADTLDFSRFDNQDNFSRSDDSLNFSLPERHNSSRSPDTNGLSRLDKHDNASRLNDTHGLSRPDKHDNASIFNDTHGLSRLDMHGNASILNDTHSFSRPDKHGNASILNDTHGLSRLDKHGNASILNDTHGLSRLDKHYNTSTSADSLDSSQSDKHNSSKSDDNLDFSRANKHFNLSWPDESNNAIPPDDHDGLSQENMVDVNGPLLGSVSGDLSCVIGRFLPAPAVKHADTKYIRSGSGTEGTLVARYECQLGYRLERAAAYRLWCSQRSWRGEVPHCVPSGEELSELDSSPHCAECDQVCHQRPGEPPLCSCYRGFLPRGPNCLDINECSTENGGCDDVCVNTAGSYFCRCPSGFRIDIDGKTCRDINECLLRNGHGPCQDTCTNLHGSYRCSCDGLSGTHLSSDNHTCDDVDECAAGTAGCSHTCLNTLGRVFCLCPSGYELGPDWKTCQDLDECQDPQLQTEVCDAECINTVGSYLCRSPGDQPAEEECDGGGSGLCSLRGSRTTERAEVTCPEGLRRGKDSQCEDVDECSVDNGGCAHRCVNTRGGHHCRCKPGFSLDLDTRSCIEAARAVVCPPLDTPGHGYLQCERQLITVRRPRYRSRRRVVNHAGTVCRLHCPLGSGLRGTYRRVCTTAGTWAGPHDGVCLRFMAPTIRCPEDVVTRLPPGQRKTHVLFDQPDASVDWFRHVFAEPMWAKRLEGDLPLGVWKVTFTARHPVTQLTASCTLTITVDKW